MVATWPRPELPRGGRRRRVLYRTLGLGLLLASCREDRVAQHGPSTPAASSSWPSTEPGPSGTVDVGSAPPSLASLVLTAEPPSKGGEWPPGFRIELSPREEELLCEPLAHPSAELSLCPVDCEPAHVPHMGTLCPVEVRQLDGGQRRTTNRFIRGTPNDDIGDRYRSLIGFVIRMQGDELVIDGAGAAECEDEIYRVDGLMLHKADLAGARAVVGALCAQRGRYGWTGSRFERLVGAAAEAASQRAEAAAAAAAAAPRPPPFDGDKWLRDHGLDFEAAFGETADAGESRDAGSWPGCKPLALPSVDVMVCSGYCDYYEPRVPLIFQLCRAEVLYVRGGRLHTVDTFVHSHIPPEADPDPAVPDFNFRFRADGDELLVEDTGRWCALSLAKLRVRMTRRPEVRATHAVVQEVCAKEGRYRWNGARFVKVAELHASGMRR